MEARGAIFLFAAALKALEGRPTHRWALRRHQPGPIHLVAKTADLPLGIPFLFSRACLKGRGRPPLRRASGALDRDDSYPLTSASRYAA
jgi:hypothetical protein